jgi:hypothetical protein
MVTVWPTPKGSPTASTRSPTWTRSLSARIGEQHLGLELALVGECHDDVGTALHHVVIGQDDAVGAHDDAGAERLLHPLAHAGAAEQLGEQGIGEERIRRRLHHGAGVDVHHRRRDTPDDGREGELDLRHRAGHDARRIGESGRGERGKNECQRE